MTFTPLRRLLLAVLVSAAFLGLASPAHAGLLVASAPDCDAQPLERPFLRWLDPAQYFLAPDGSFTGQADGWQRSGAAVVADDQPWSAHAGAVEAALAIGPGGSATSPTVCVGLEHPTLRFFAHNDGSLLSTLSVEVLFEDAGGTVRALPIGLVTATRAWSPTLPMPILASLLPLLPGEHTPVAFRFKARGGGWTIDDVYVDPYHKG